MLLEYRDVSCNNKKNFHMSGIDFKLDTGFLMGLLGKNGAGKTTLFRLMLNPGAAYSGQILFDGEDIRNNHPAFLDQIGYVADDNRFVPFYTAKQNALLLGKLYGSFEKERFGNAMKKMNVPESREVGKLSRGEFIKFQLAFAYAHRPRLYLLDEATAGMDPVFRREFYRLLREVLAEEEAAALMSTHLQGDVDRNMDYIAVLEQGRLVSFQENEK